MSYELDSHSGFSRSDLDPRIDIVGEYGNSAVTSRIRMNLRNYSADLRNVRNDVIDTVPVPDGGVVLDVGCSDGENLLALAIKNGDRAQYIGVDIETTLIKGAIQRARNYKRPDVRFFTSNANRIGLRSHSLSVILSQRMQYHVVPDPESGLEEYCRTLRPDGIMVLTTPGPDDKEVHREFENAIAKSLGKKPPPIFAAPFNTVEARAKLPKFFGKVVESPHRSQMIITPELVGDYIQSLYTMFQHFSPVMTGEDGLQYKEALTDIVYPKIWSDIDDRGYFSDTIEDSIFYCTQPRE